MTRLYLLLVCVSCCISVSAQNMRLVGVGSSTIAGQGAFPADSSWMRRFSNYYKNGLGLVDSVYNLGFPGANCYRGMPSSYMPPPMREGPVAAENVTHAVNLLSGMAIPANGVVIINYPTNQYTVFSIAEIMNCLQVMYDSATRLGNKCYITTSQPRTDGSFNTPAMKRKLADIKDSIINRFTVANTLNFWDGMYNPADTTILSMYSAGDNIHFNNAGHRELFERVRAKNVFGITLPVKLHQFSAALQDKKVAVQWQADHDDPLGSFAVQRSQNGQDFELLQQLPVNNQMGLHSYAFTDQSPLPGTSYYRLAVRERDRTYYSKTVMIKNALPALAVQRIYPVPADKRLQMEIVAAQAQAITIDIRNSGGVSLQRFTRSVSNGVNQVYVPVVQLPAGLYFVRVTGAHGESFTRSFSK
ncbi:MAG: T9SS type A sorting domain-containing protein [Niastella sp.]|nr:T9SS type A sorting domain-containing protein [Niastella sp.]